MKKIILSIATALFSFIAFAAAPTAVSEKALSAFSKSFKDAKEVVWSEYENYYEVRFMHNSVRSWVTYDEDGNILKSRRYYQEDMLPLLIKAKINKRHSDKKIFGITEMASDAEVTYYIILEDDKNWLTVKSDAFGTLSVYEKFKKAPTN
ncbi:MAG TPA: hypothetical protein VNA26_07215 [Chitinophagaceae bacterium]|nr:hypothetical protein [Chitinophagaceae bacterium]